MQGKRSSEVHRIKCTLCTQIHLLCEKMNLACKTGHFYFILYKNPCVNPVIYNVYQYKKKNLEDDHFWTGCFLTWCAISPSPSTIPCWRSGCCKSLGSSFSDEKTPPSGQSAPWHKLFRHIIGRRNGTDKTWKTNLKWKRSLCISVLFSQNIAAPSKPHFPSAKQTRCNVGVTNVKSSFQTASLLHPAATAPRLSWFLDKVHNGGFFNWSTSLTPVKSQTSLPRNKSKLAWRWCKSHKHLFCFNTSFSH